MKLFHRMTLTALLLAAFSGCSGRNGMQIGNMTQSLKETLNLAEKPQMPIQRIEPLWKAAKGNDLKGFPTRGAAGQILFFAAGSETPTKLEGDGTIVVYIFDDQGPREHRTTPIFKYTFDLAAWNAFLQEDGALGPSYHVFIPYSRKTVYQATMSLSVQLRGTDGKVLAMSTLADVVLSGPKPTSKVENENLAVRETSRRRTNLTTLNRQTLSRDQRLGREFSGIQQTSGIRRSTHPMSADRSPHESAAALLEQHPDLRHQLESYRRKTGNPVRSESRENGRRDAGRSRDHEPPAAASRGFRLGGTPRVETSPARDPFTARSTNARSLLNEQPKSPRNPFADNRNEQRHPLDRHGFDDRSESHPFARNTQRNADSNPFGGHPLRGSAFDGTNRDRREDEYTRPTFSEPIRRVEADSFNQPTAGSLLEGGPDTPFPQSRRSDKSDSRSGFRLGNSSGFRPQIDSRRAWDEN